MSNDSLILIAKALADPQRLAILERIAREEEVACQTLVDEFDITQATISHHITQLVQAGLIESRKVGRCCHFRLNGEGVAAFSADLAGRLGASNHENERSPAPPEQTRAPAKKTARKRATRTRKS